MQKNPLTRLIAGILTLCLMLGNLAPVTALATETETTDLPSVDTTTEETSATEETSTTEETTETEETTATEETSATEETTATEPVEPIADAEDLYVDNYTDFVAELKLLEAHAASYAATSGKNAGELVLNFLRTGVDRYNDGNWKTLAGEEITEFTAYVAAQDAANQTTVMRLRNIELFTLPNGQQVDFGHMFGTMNIAYISAQGSADLGGWAGDICDLMLYSKNYGHVPAGTVEEMAEFIRINCFGVNADDAFGMDDYYGDMDAIYLIAQMKNGTLLSVAMESYFTAGQSDVARAEFFLKNRFTNLYTRESVREAVYNAYVSNVGLQVLEAGRDLTGETDLRKASCYAFADYVYDLAGHTLEEPEEDPEEPGEEPENPYYTVFSSTESILAPGIVQTIKYATTADNKQIVYYLADVNVNRDDVTIMANYHDADPSKGWAMQRVTDQVAALVAKHTNPEDPDNYIENFQAIVSTNADGFNMSTGEPGGLLVMGGVEWYPVDSHGFFAILKDGSAMIGTKADYETYKDQIQEAVGGFGAVLIKDGNVVTTDNGGRASRTAIGIKADGSVVMMVLDGRQEPFSAGGSMVEIAQIMLEAGCVHAINLDGGGSTTFASKPEGSDNVVVVNRPSDGYQRSVATSLVAVSTAKSSKEFDHANITSDYDYLTVGTQLQMTANGVSNTGNAAPLPEDATWAVSDATVGAITEDGLFTALENGEVEVQMVSGGQIVGTKTLNVVIPDTLEFTQKSMNVVYGVKVKLPLLASYEGNPVAINDNDVFAGGEYEEAAIFEGPYMTTLEESGVRSMLIAALLLSNEEADCVMRVSMYCADEAYFDFENITSGNRTLAWIREVDNAVTNDGVFYQVVTPGEDMTTEYTFGLDMTAIAIPDQLADLTYMLPGADQGSTAWDFLLLLAERVGELTEVKITAQLDPNMDVDISEMTISNEYFKPSSIHLDENNVLTIICKWQDQTQAIDPATANSICILSGIKMTPKEDASWNAQNRLPVAVSGHVSYRIFLRASSLYSFACKPDNQAKYGLLPYSGDQEEFYLNGEPLIYGDGPERGAYFGTTYADFLDTYTLDRSVLQGWQEQDGKMYYFVDHVPYKDCVKELPGQEDPENKYFYAFDTDGICTGKTTGLVNMGGALYYTVGGVAKTGWVSVMNGSKVDYYFFNTRSRQAIDGEWNIGGYNYLFEDCVLKRGQLVVDSKGTRYMWAGSWVSQEWLEIDGKIAYARSSNYFATGLTRRYSPEGDWTYYAFSEDGWWMKDFSGIYDWKGGTYLIKEGIVIDYPGLFEWEGDYYYIASTNVMIKNKFYWISKTNGIVPEGRYWFDADGKMTIPEEPTPDPEPEEPVVKKNGIIAEEGTLFYYINGVRTYGGVLYIDGYYYYARTNGEIVNNRNYWTAKTNGLIPEKSYNFDEQGRITNPPGAEPENPNPGTPEKKNGIVEENGKLFYYVDGSKAYAGLIKIDGYWYYVRTSGQLAQGVKYWPTKTNGHLNTKRQYTFDELGRMTDCDFDDTAAPPPGEVKNGIVAEDGSLFYYVDGKRNYAGLICIDGNWYYVRTNGELAHDIDYWPTKTNGYMKTTKRYYFDSNGVMQNPPAELLEAAN